MKVNWQGVFPALCTQFHPDQSLNIPGTLKHLDAMLDAGVHGVVMMGSVGENTTLELAEKKELLKAAVEHVGKRVPVLTGVAEYTTAGACRWASEAAKLGADGLMVLPPMVYKSDDRETVAHFRTVAGASDLPIMVYNNPPAYKVDITPAMFVEMADEPKFACIKESSDNPRRITDIINLTKDRYVIFAGVDDLVVECMILGAVGWVSGLVNAFPAENRLLWDLAQAGKWKEALDVYRWYTPLLHLDTHVKLVQYIKLAAAECGYGTELCRSPRLPLVGPEREHVLKLIRTAIATRPTR
ncbi:4-hydroxy-tetrahydrodipicolinate synthase [Gemmata obscuriglobus]|uniref:Dihydrodipicolinate synthase family protein n=1 Tax=Gemmata obscuriglobus TaxID=114 RepID=A0A2Z3H252_9BACT|nr:dihydrodipicolinate synthase family protein [Gemmata obscuriglobus]AWM38931.1 dihydrodipicolinate synthase family protein [Gemmata obscuriglobus]QEG28067.1 4-hydroxy-tetrahydrodipicolinate synthase [Gemmata obscuriglobus]VTS05662.1 dihydrodipicolinate synthase : Dihydrodipicolinate synthetase family protein OS=Blastopirellula marina DSM 3645 GN=DSM3645_02128 PE=3 SV=1: DHDPS [Gemmata obscuriglobus UQM 2246]